VKFSGHRREVITIGLGLAAIVLLAGAIWGWQSLERYKSQHAKQREVIFNFKADSGDKYAEICLKEGVSFLDIAKCVMKSIDANREAQRSQYDLQAQQEMAEWAYALLLLTIASTIIGACGFIGLMVSLSQTRTAIKDSREIGEAQVASYVSIPSASVFFIGATGQPIVEIHAVNNGQSPAIGFVWTAVFRYFSEVEGYIESEFDTLWMERPGVDIPPQGKVIEKFMGPDFELTTTTAEWKAKTNHVGMSITILFSWKDVFKNVRTDKAAFLGVAETRPVKQNVRENPLNTSTWFCDLNPMAKDSIWSGIVVRAPIKKRN
jgi:hypothetical protein